MRINGGKCIRFASLPRKVAMTPYPVEIDGLRSISEQLLFVGLPKGAMLTNAAMASTTYAVSYSLCEHDMNPNDVNISYLPASHVFERELQVNPREL